MKTKNLIFIIIATCLICGCTDKDYDFSKGVDKTVYNESDLSMPLGRTQFIRIGDLLGDNAKNSLIKLIDGKYCLVYEGDRISHEIEIPQIEISNAEMQPTIVSYNCPSALIGLSPGNFPSGTQTVYTYQLQTPQGEDLEFDIKVDEALPDVIEDLLWADVNSTLGINFSINSGKITLKQGVTIKFPDFLFIKTSPSSSSFTEAVDSHTLRLTRDMSFSSTSALSIKVIISRIDVSNMPSHGIRTVGSEKRLVINEFVKISGNFSADMRNFNPVPSTVRLESHINIESASVKSASAKLNLQQSIDDQVTEIGSPIKFLYEDGVKLDLWNPCIWLRTSNNSPAEAQMDFDLSTYIADNQIASAHIGANSPEGSQTETLLLESGDKTIYLSRRGGLASLPNEKDIVVPALGAIFDKVPESIKVSGIKFSTISSDFQTFDLTSPNYGISVEYGLKAPLAFGRDMSIEYSHDIKGMSDLINSESEEFSLCPHILAIGFTVNNALPLELGLEIMAMDSDGQPLTQGVRTESKGRILPGSPSAKSSSELSISLEMEDDSWKHVDGVRLKIIMKGSSEQAFEGQVITEDHGFQLTKIWARVASGVHLDIF